MRSEQEIVASQIAGDFVLPDNPRQKCVFIAGGIGITPFRSMIKYLLDTHQRRPIIIFYSNRSAEDVVYQDVFDRAERELGIKTIYTVTDPNHLTPGWKGKVGRITPDWIKKAVPGYRSHMFYISGPAGMIDSFTATLHQLRVKDSHIKTDYFSGLS
jgi:glycine betaine catabolism B